MKFGQLKYQIMKNFYQLIEIKEKYKYVASRIKKY